ncbi:ankyrin repeat domain-containing protein [Actinokineospora globicatena]|uniref:ankyrin repeat domain-containing protein n=1 Tax=Actinokineospora globicatena TaxID=103729 RepID=UPI0020A36720|nr:ankyrin repeat domain-containing protein [Actinokineospora globicatena]MCP2303391.1 Ankyrin repeat-containing protein [Actinokineospora globicatena]GLW79475.1 hypothetical protein Aglo01_39570 [Actinokineospora globicatena]GLW86115.1 hypothetical protein Aglo02_37540 [Actinokineospora globicatena]
MSGKGELHQIALKGTAEQAAAVVAAGGDAGLADSHGFTPLHLAAQVRNVAVAEVLLAAGAPVDAVNEYGNTPLFVAVFNSRGHGEAIALLRAHGADPAKVNNAGQTPLGLARLIANYDVRRFFADID